MAKINTITSTNATENGADGIFTITLDSPAPVGGLLINFNTLGSSALLNSDYALLAGANISNLMANSFIINSGATTANLTVQANNDNLIETTENINLNLSVNTPSDSISFYAKADVTTGSNPVSVSTGDFNADGKLDLAVANESSNSVSVLLRNTTNTGFESKVDVATGSNPVSVSTGDFNNDGKLDLAVANWASNSVSVLLRNTTNTGFESKVDVATGSNPVSVSTGDFNNDGKLDLAVANEFSNSVSVLLRNTTNTGFESKVDVTTGLYPVSVSTGDFNADGKLDLAVANSNNNNVSVLLRNTTNTGFESKVDVATGSNPNSVSTGDFNADGKLDLAVANWTSNSVSVLLRNTTNTGFESKVDVATGSNPYSVSTGDFNADGKLDLAVANWASNSVSVLLRNTTNTGFEAKVDVATGSYPRSVSTGDFNADGKLDLAVANSNNNNVSVLLNTSPITRQNLSQSLNVIDTSNNANPTGDSIINGTLAQNQLLTASNTLADSDGLGTVNYQWFANNSPINGATTNNYLLTQNEVGKSMSVTASYTDGHGMNESVSSEYSELVANSNDAPTGAVIIVGTATQKQVLTVSNTLNDSDGLGAIKYQWFANTIAIKNATANTLLLSNNQVNKTISVTASYTDGQGTNESVNSSATREVVNLNDLAKGAVVINNMTPKANDILTANNSITDADGLGYITYTWKTGTTVLGTGDNYTVTTNDVGNTIIVTASYTDAFGTNETINSKATAAVWGNHAPTGSILIDGTAIQNQTLTATNTLADADGLGTLHYQWFANNNALTGAMTNSYLLTQNEVNKTISLTVSYTDGQGNNESVNSNTTSAVQNSNDLPTGVVTISGLAQQGQLLTVSNNLADADGLGTINYQWLTNGIIINGATNNNYALTKNEAGKTLSVIASYTDAFGTKENVNSNSTSAVIASTITVTGSNFITGETGNTASFSITLTTQPLRDVSISLNTSDNSEGIISSAQTITFTASNWNIAQNLMITGVNDGLNDGDISYQITGVINSTDVNYSSVPFSPLNLINQDDGRDTPLVLIGDKNGIPATDILQGLDANDSLYGGYLSDDLSGGLGDDSLYGGYGNDFLYGQTGNDYLSGEQDNDFLDGGNGNDSISGGDGSDTLQGSAGNDSLDGSNGADTMSGGAGNDIYYLGYDATDTVQDSGLTSDVDTIIMPYLIASYTLPTDIENGSIAAGTQASNLTGNVSNNTLTGNNGNNILSGAGGRDSLFGGVGSDTLSGGVANDTLNGGTGKDIFKFDAIIMNNIDKITDFNVTDDTIQLKNTVFTALTIKGVLNTSMFVVNTTAVDNNDYIIYDKSTGNIFYDADGNGAGAAIQIATVGVNLAITNADFVVV